MVCGRTGRPLEEGVCADCAADRTRLLALPRRGEVVVCPGCGARKVGSRWERAGSPEAPTSEDLVPFLEIHPEVGVRSVSGEEVSATATVRELVAHARVRFRGLEREVELPFSVRVLHQSCSECSRRSGKYYTAVLQLRGPAEGRGERPRELRTRLDALWEELLGESRQEWRNAVSWREQRPEGWDCFFLDTLAARSIARVARQRFGASVKESASLVGRKDGHDVYRVTVCLRFPPPGTVVAPRGRARGSRHAAGSIPLRSAPPLERPEKRGTPL